MARAFENVTDGEREIVDASASLFALLFGMIFFAVKGLWRHVAIQAVVIVVSLVAFGAPGIMIALVMWIVYAVMAPSIIGASLLRDGWKEVSEDAPVGAAMKVSDERLCPFCAEPIKRAAIKCRHCHSDVPAFIAPAVAEVPAKAFAPRVVGQKPLAAGDMECFNCKKHIPEDAVSCAFCGHRYLT